LDEVGHVRTKGWNDSYPGFATCILSIPYLAMEIDTHRGSSSDEGSEENSDSWDYDTSHAPREGSEYQATYLPDVTQENPETPDLGELIWNPAMIQKEAIERFLELTKVTPEFDWDEVMELLDSEKEKGDKDKDEENEVDFIMKEVREKLYTEDDAMTILHRCDYDVDKAVAQMKGANNFWSQKKRNIAKWTKQEIEKFELGMHNSDRDFRGIVRSELVGLKNFADAVQYYYIWKKSKRCKVWKKRNKTLYAQLVSADNAYTRNKAPLKGEASIRHLMSEGRLRNRPRIDYSNATWRLENPDNRKRKHDDHSEEPSYDDKLDPRDIEPPKPKRTRRLTKKEREAAAKLAKENASPEETPSRPTEGESESGPESLLNSSEIPIDPKDIEPIEAETQAAEEKTPEQIRLEKREAASYRASSRLKNINQKSFYPFHSNSIRGTKKRRVEPEEASTPPGTPDFVEPESAPATPELVDEEDEEDEEGEYRLSGGVTPTTSPPRTPEYDDGDELDEDSQNTREDISIEEDDENGTPAITTIATPYLTTTVKVGKGDAPTAALNTNGLPNFDPTNFSNAVGTSSPPNFKITNIDTAVPIPNTTLILNVSGGESHLNPTKFVAEGSQTSGKAASGGQQGTSSGGGGGATGGGGKKTLTPGHGGTKAGSPAPSPLANLSPSAMATAAALQHLLVNPALFKPLMDPFGGMKRPPTTPPMPFPVTQNIPPPVDQPKTENPPATANPLTEAGVTKASLSSSSSGDSNSPNAKKGDKEQPPPTSTEQNLASPPPPQTQAPSQFQIHSTNFPMIPPPLGQPGFPGPGLIFPFVTPPPGTSPAQTAANTQRLNQQVQFQHKQLQSLYMNLMNPTGKTQGPAAAVAGTPAPTSPPKDSAATPTTPPTAGTAALTQGESSSK